MSELYSKMYTNTSEITFNPESKDLDNALEANASQVFASFVDEIGNTQDKVAEAPAAQAPSFCGRLLLKVVSGQ